MKKILIAGVALLSLTACQDKIAFIDNAKLLDNYQEKKDIKAKLDNCLLMSRKKNITN